MSEYSGNPRGRTGPSVQKPTLEKPIVHPCAHEKTPSAAQEDFREVEHPHDGEYVTERIGLMHHNVCDCVEDALVTEQR